MLPSRMCCTARSPNSEFTSHAIAAAASREEEVESQSSPDAGHPVWL